MQNITIVQDHFLSKYLERNCYTLKAWKGKESLASRLHATLGSGKAFVTARSSCADTGTLSALTTAGFYLADVNLTFEMQPRLLPPPTPTARLATAEDATFVSRLAKGSFSYSRFHRDPNIPNERANSFKKAWAENFFASKRGDSMIIAENAGTVVGFVQLLFDGDAMVVDLITVSNQHRRQGFGAAMLARAGAEHPGFTTLRTGTQAANVPSVRFYENLGFRLTASTMVLHLWKD